MATSGDIQAGLEQKKLGIQERQADEALKSLDTHRKELIKMQGLGYTLEGQRNKIQTFSALSDDHYRKGLITADQRRQDLDAEKFVHTQLMDQAKEQGDLATARYHKSLADKADAETDILQKTGGKKPKTYEQERLEQKDLLDAEVKLMENASSGGAKGAVPNVNAQLPEDATRGYFWEEGTLWGGDAKQIVFPYSQTLGRTITMKDVRAKAREKGVPVEEVISIIAKGKK